MRKLNVPSYSILLSKEKRIRAIQELYMKTSEIIDSGGSSGRPATDSVGTEQIKNNSIMLEDLNKEVIDKMLDSASTETCEAIIDELT